MLFTNLNLGKRRHIRVEPEKTLPIEVSINGGNFLDILTAQDISVGGVSIVVPHEFKGCQINGTVSLVITLPEPIRKSFQVTGEIRHVSGKIFGIRFMDISESDKLNVRNYVAYRLNGEPWDVRLRHKMGFF